MTRRCVDDGGRGLAVPESCAHDYDGERVLTGMH